MKEKIEKFIKKNVYICILFIIIVSQLGINIYTFSFEKDGYFLDETANYGLSNSYYKPFMNGNNLNSEEIKNVWLTGEDFKNYICVNDDTKFSYGSVWSNQALDYSPPLHYAILHTISSFFPNVFSWWYSFSINLVSFAVAQIFIYKLFLKIGKSKIVGLLTCGLFGFSLGGQSIVIYLRFYCLYMMFAVVFAYFMHKPLEKEKLSKKDLIAILLATTGGALTHHTFLIFAFLYALFTCLILLCRKDIRKMLSVGISALLGVILSVAIFPATINHFVDTTGSEDSLFTIKTDDISTLSYRMFRLLIRDTFGYEMSIYENPNIAYVIAGFVLLVALLIPLCFLFRKEKWFIKIKDKFMALISKIRDYLKNGDLSLIIMLLVMLVFIVAITFIIPENVQSATLIFSFVMDRYIFILIPFLCGFTVCIIYKIICLIKIRNIKTISTCIVLALASFSLVFANVKSDSNYIFKSQTDNGYISSYLNNADCIMLVNYPTIANVPAYMLMDCDNIFYSIYSDNVYQQFSTEYDKLKNTDKPTYLMFDICAINDKDKDNGMLNKSDIISYFEKEFGCKLEYCTSETAGFTPFSLYRIK